MGLIQSLASIFQKPIELHIDFIPPHFQGKLLRKENIIAPDALSQNHPFTRYIDSKTQVGAEGWFFIPVENVHRLFFDMQNSPVTSGKNSIHLLPNAQNLQFAHATTAF